MSVTTSVILGIIVVVTLWVALSYNRLVAMRQRCDRAFADIEAQLRRRHDLVPNLVETVKAYASHERGTLDAVVRARDAAVAAEGPAAKGPVETEFSGALGRLLAVAESYPDLKANRNFRQLQTELSGVENRLAGARRSFNSMVQAYNSMIQKFPTVLFAGALGFAPHEFFSAGDEREAADRAPQVRF